MLIATDPNSDWKARSLADAMETSLPTMYHLLNTLVDAGLVTIDDRGICRLGINIGRLAAAYQQQIMPPSELQVPLHAVTKSTGESSYLSAWRNGEMEVILHIPSTLPVRVMELRAGFRGVAHARAAGKVLLAFGTADQRERYLAPTKLESATQHTITDKNILLAELARVRENQYAEEHEEFCEGVGCLSVPILANSELLGAYTISAPIDRLMTRRIEYLKVLRNAAESAKSGAESALSRMLASTD
jgi:DNA-binding IclR family transcriptional regulator